MPHARSSRPASRTMLAAAMPAVACTGCNVLGAVFHEHLLAGVAFVVVAVAAVGFLVSRGARRR